METLYTYAPVLGTGTADNPRYTDLYGWMAVPVGTVLGGPGVSAAVGCQLANGDWNTNVRSASVLPWVIVEDYGYAALVTVTVEDGTLASVLAQSAACGVAVSIGTSKADLIDVMTARRNAVFQSLPAAVRTALGSGDRRAQIRQWIKTNSASAGDNFFESIKEWFLSIIDDEPGINYPRVFRTADDTYDLTTLASFTTYYDARASTHRLVILLKILELWLTQRALGDLG